MKISLNWLSDYIEIENSAEQIAEILSDLGFPCEAIVQVGDDTIIDIEITSNRGDCLSYIGTARELAAVTGKELKIPEVELDPVRESKAREKTENKELSNGVNELNKDVTEFASVEIAEPDLCGRYTARVIEAVKVGPSPDWLKKRLEAVGLRSVNNVVDATNYAMMETGQPPHAFDYAKIKQGKIVVRKAISGERLVSIDSTTCSVNTDMLIIADAEGPVAIAGVMGGLETEVGNTTTTILLEDAYFDPVSVRTTSRRLALPSEAAFRFERTVDIEMIDWASKRTAQLITQVAGGKVARGVVDIYPKKPAQKEVTLRLSRLNKLLGIEIPVEEVVRILSALSFKPQRKDDVVACTVPSWRSDVYREVDLIEEVTRVHGYNKIPTEQKISIEVAPVNAHQKLALAIGTYLNSCGFYETITVGLIDNSIAELFTDPRRKEHLRVRDQSSKSANLLRQSLIGPLLNVLKTNLNAKNLPCRIFEIANTFVPTGKAGTLPIEKTKLALVCDSDLRDLHGVIEGLIKNIDRDAQIVFTPAELVWAQTSAKIKVNGQIIGTTGMVLQAVKEKFDFKNLSPVTAELDFERLLSLHTGTIKVKPIPRFPAIERDLSIIVDETIKWADIVEAVNEKATAELQDIRFIGIYRGKGVPTGKKSVTLSLCFRDEDGTLTHKTVDHFEANIVTSLTQSLGAELRTI